MQQSIGMLFWVVVVLGCSPVSVTRIGPAMPSRGQKCDMQVLAPGERPDRPHRDIGMVHISNCQDYTVGLCRDWLVESACELGGNVAYLPEPHPPKNEIDAVNYRVSVAVFIANLPPSPAEVCQEPPPNETDPEMERCKE